MLCNARASSPESVKDIYIGSSAVQISTHDCPETYTTAGKQLWLVTLQLGSLSHLCVPSEPVSFVPCRCLVISPISLPGAGYCQISLSLSPSPLLYHPSCVRVLRVSCSSNAIPQGPQKHADHAHTPKRQANKCISLSRLQLKATFKVVWTNKKSNQ